MFIVAASNDFKCFQRTADETYQTLLCEAMMTAVVMFFACSKGKRSCRGSGAIGEEDGGGA